MSLCVFAQYNFLCADRSLSCGKICIFKPYQPNAREWSHWRITAEGNCSGICSSSGSRDDGRFVKSRAPQDPLLCETDAQAILPTASEVASRQGHRQHLSSAQIGSPLPGQLPHGVAHPFKRQRIHSLLHHSPFPAAYRKKVV